MKNLIVSDTGPLISLEKLPDGFSFIRKLYSKISIPPKVIAEVSSHYSDSQKYLKKHGVDDFIEIHAVDPITDIPNIIKLDDGEIEAISLAKKQQTPLLIEEKNGKQSAMQMGLKVSGIGGQIVKAYKIGIIQKEEAVSKLKILQTNRRLNPRIFKGLVQSIAP